MARLQRVISLVYGCRRPVVLAYTYHLHLLLSCVMKPQE